MKKLNKLQINPQKIMKNEELVILRGGYDEWGCQCANAWDAGVFPWEPPSHTFVWFECSSVDQWRGIMESSGHYTAYCPVA